MGHSVIRTNPRGRPFVGRCSLCGEENLGLAAALVDCPREQELRDQQALFRLLKEEAYGRVEE